MQMHRGITTRLRTDMDFMLQILWDQRQMRFCLGALFEVPVSLLPLSVLFVVTLVWFVYVCPSHADHSSDSYSYYVALPTSWITQTHTRAEIPYPWRDSNPQSPPSEADALSIRPHGLCNESTFVEIRFLDGVPLFIINNLPTEELLPEDDGSLARNVANESKE